nr:immunoglobulin light chain junction region [Macaca mulatta]MOW71467.1 immunoglobulin light chain junction region [Macaca mulatta]
DYYCQVWDIIIKYAVF